MELKDYWENLLLIATQLIWHASKLVLPWGEPKQIEVGKCVYLVLLQTFKVNWSEFGDPCNWSANNIICISGADHCSILEYMMQYLLSITLSINIFRVLN